MSYKIPGEKENVKRRRMMKEVREEGAGVPMEEECTLQSASSSLSGSQESLPGFESMNWDVPTTWSGSTRKAAERMKELLTEHLEETSHLFSSKKRFRERVNPLSIGEWGKACRSLINCANRCTPEVEHISYSKERICDECLEAYNLTLNVTGDQLDRHQWALRETYGRYKSAVRNWREEKKERERIEERMSRISEEKRAAELERDQLHAALVAQTEANRVAEAERNRLSDALSAKEKEEKSWRERSSPPPPSNTEMEEVEMREGVSPPPLSTPGEVTIPAILGALEEWFEAKWARMLSSGACPPTGGEMVHPRPQVGPVPGPAWLAGGPGRGRNPPRRGHRAPMREAREEVLAPRRHWSAERCRDWPRLPVRGGPRGRGRGKRGGRSGRHFRGRPWWQLAPSPAVRRPGRS